MFVLSGSLSVSEKEASLGRGQEWTCEGDSWKLLSPEAQGTKSTGHLEPGEAPNFVSDLGRVSLYRAEREAKMSSLACCRRNTWSSSSAQPELVWLLSPGGLHRPAGLQVMVPG